MIMSRAVTTLRHEEATASSFVASSFFDTFYLSTLSDPEDKWRVEPSNPWFPHCFPTSLSYIVIFETI